MSKFKTQMSNQFEMTKQREKNKFEPYALNQIILPFRPVFRYVPLDEVVEYAERCWLNALEPFMHDWSCVRNIEESVGLLLGQDFVDAVIDLLPFFSVKGPTPFNEQPVDFGVLEPNEIVFSLFRLARMPYVVEVRIPAHAPPKDDS